MSDFSAKATLKAAETRHFVPQTTAAFNVSSKNQTKEIKPNFHRLSKTSNSKPEKPDGQLPERQKASAKFELNSCNIE